MYTRWQQDLRSVIPTARIVELPGANIYMEVKDDFCRRVRDLLARHERADS
jgi:hypothetical protein